MTFKKFNAFLLMNDREARAFMSKLEPDDLAALEEMMDQAQAARDKANAEEKGAVSPAPTAAAPKPALGPSKDGSVFTMTRSQAANPAFCFRTQEARSKAGSVELVPE
jgi:hypothetical protein